MELAPDTFPRKCRPYDGKGTPSGTTLFRFSLQVFPPSKKLSKINGKSFENVTILKLPKDGPKN